MNDIRLSSKLFVLCYCSKISCMKHIVGLEGTLFGQQRAVPGMGLLHSTAGKNGLHRSTASPSSAHRSDVMRDGRHDSETRARHQTSLHHSTASSRDQSV